MLSQLVVWHDLLSHKPQKTLPSPRTLTRKLNCVFNLRKNWIFINWFGECPFHLLSTFIFKKCPIEEIIQLFSSGRFKSFCPINVMKSSSPELRLVWLCCVVEQVWSCHWCHLAAACLLCSQSELNSQTDNRFPPQCSTLLWTRTLQWREMSHKLRRTKVLRNYTPKWEATSAWRSSTSVLSANLSTSEKSVSTKICQQTWVTLSRRITEQFLWTLILSSGLSL